MVYAVWPSGAIWVGLSWKVETRMTSGMAANGARTRAAFRRECLVRDEPLVVVKGDLDGGANGAEVLFVAVERLLRLDAVGGKTTGAQDGANLR